MRAGKPPAFVWQPVSDVPKVSLIPLLIGTLKISAVAGKVMVDGAQVMATDIMASNGVIHVIDAVVLP